MLWTEKASKILMKYWGFSSLKPKQEEAINALLLGNDVLGLLPTGGGKSMLYLIPPLVKKRAMIIISPLISLMDDQKDKLVKMNIPVSALHSNNKNKDRDIYDIIDGNIKIIYMSPEYLVKGDGFELIESMKEKNPLGFLAIDEAHCISVWGHDFRPEYLKITTFRDKYPEIPIMAVTATATKHVINEIITSLNMKNPTIITANFDRPNLFLRCESVKEIDVHLLLPYFDKYINDKIIVYTNSRDDTVELSEEINKIHPNGKVSEAYHAKMPKALRESVQQNFANGTTKIILSTIAFGMGVDQIVRCVVVFGAPSSIEEYWQQIGRAGRDTLEAETILFFQFKSLKIQEAGLKNYAHPRIRECKQFNLKAISHYFYLNKPMIINRVETPVPMLCRRKFVLEHFNQVPTFFRCYKCDICCDNNHTDITNFILHYLYNKKLTDEEEENEPNVRNNLLKYRMVREYNKKIFINNGMTNYNAFNKNGSCKNCSAEQKCDLHGCTQCNEDSRCSNHGVYYGLENWVKYINKKYNGNIPDVLPRKLAITLPIIETEDADIINKYVNKHKKAFKKYVSKKKPENTFSSNEFLD